VRSGDRVICKSKPTAEARRRGELNESGDRAIARDRVIRKDQIHHGDTEKDKVSPRMNADDTDKNR